MRQQSASPSRTVAPSAQAPRALSLVITGTDTGVGKTVLTALLGHYALSLGWRVQALKPICSGGRGDVRAFQRLHQPRPPADAINPWHFRAPLAPLLAARLEGRRVTLDAVLAFVRRWRRSCDLLLVEGAGGLLSPLGEGFSTREWIVGLRARPVIVCPNRLGAVNQVRLVLAALPLRAARLAHVVLTPLGARGPATTTNPRLLAEFIGEDRVHVLPRITGWQRLESAARRRDVRQVLERVLAMA